MFRRKEKNYNPYDEDCRNLHQTVVEAGKRLLEATQKVIIKKNVIDLYPVGPDQDAAIEEYHESQRTLLCAIGNYDGRLQEFNQYLAKHRNQLEEEYSCWNSPLTSHKIIENVYEQFVRK